MIANPDSIEILKQNLKAWEGLHGKTLTPEAIGAWVETFKATPYAILRRALQIVTARADRMPVPGFLTKAVIEAREEALQGARPAPVNIPHISTLPQSVRDEMRRMFDETLDKIGLKYPETTPEEKEIEARAQLERNRQKQAFAVVKDRFEPTDPSQSAYVAENRPPRPAMPITETVSEPYEPTDEDIPL